MLSLGGQPTITHCTFIGNSAEYGGGMYTGPFWDRLAVTNCTFTGNSASQFGGAVYNDDPDSRTVITNCILWGNIGGEIYNDNSDLIVTYSDVQDGYTGEGNIDSNPRLNSFRGFDYLLHPFSPCVDAGDPSIEDGISDWHPRWPDWYPNGPRSDMGAYGGPGNVNWLP
jgi:predicted outer membrane repeat protein